MQESQIKERLAALWELYYKDLINVCYRRGSNFDEAEDLVSNAYVGVFEYCLKGHLELVLEDNKGRFFGLWFRRTITEFNKTKTYAGKLDILEENSKKKGSAHILDELWIDEEIKKVLNIIADNKHGPNQALIARAWLEEIERWPQDSNIDFEEIIKIVDGRSEFKSDKNYAVNKHRFLEKLKALWNQDKS